ncbi:MAG: hypothetical protein CMI54_02400 [Parcubacteria group bacterium]|jgi:hypothetical protein|nr:hypothetical protein [Parcubacteria group bacterium]|tara:strand:+ start:19709 stop:19936 length:228 start_codon:yes stop_codon:yes gene_type:complete
MEKMNNLLAIIHEDGGHYLNKNGFEKTYDDAIEKIQYLSDFKRKHDEQLMDLIDSVTWNQLHGKITPGCIVNFKK